MERTAWSPQLDLGFGFGVEIATSEPGCSITQLDPAVAMAVENGIGRVGRRLVRQEEAVAQTGHRFA